MYGIFFNTLSYQAKRFKKQWRRENTERRATKYSRLHGCLVYCGNHLAAFSFSVFAAVLFAAILCLTLPEYPGLVLAHAKASDSLPYFTALWGTQATLAALSYPIVFAFVAVNLQQRATAKLGLKVYLLDSGALVSGTSSVCLLAWMTFQYFFVPYHEADLVASFMAGNVGWFLLNAVLTGIFLFRTVLFLSDTHRLRAISSYAVHVALPREMALRLPTQLLLAAKQNGWVPNTPDDSDPTQPRIEWFRLGDDEACVELTSRPGLRIVDIRLRLLDWAIRLWMSRLQEAQKIEMTDWSAQDAIGRQPWLLLPICPGTPTSSKTPICSVRNAPPPGVLARTLLRWSIDLGRPKDPGDDETVAILTELVSEVVSLLEKRHSDAAIQLVVHVVDVHATLLNASVFKNAEGELEHIGQLQDGNFFRTIHERWVDEYRSLAEAAIDTIESDNRFFRKRGPSTVCS
ncbi:hypothetical protein [Cupriavidus taiwanensis]|nr:hypothetical protein [Cupriavidus taiwanensis]SPD62136.1 conserved membrane protein of unknown function [Cupriavidus neocaledonicus]ULX55977.1 hypothetical protein A9P79_28785 [Cupriavidus taiwanensis]SOZ22185.1 conserved hypothetical protein; putative membrane protein [Cupriavidus taiwanensis]SOZ34306.1 conserved hypothetical protein; putative membrane protein [Cupriavidus taiwanensis]SPD61393.1 conserved membrane protein of unknown function [Cupriavidus taiwanensis]